MAYLDWIEDDDLVSSVNHLLQVSKAALDQSEKNFSKNVIDPFSAVFQIAGFDISYDTWKTAEHTRQSQKTLQNHIGEFHQIVLGHIKGWENLRTGNVMDLLSLENKLVAEIKNKHNTVTGSNLASLYRSLEDLVMPKSSRFKGFTAYYVVIIPKRPGRFDLPFVPSDKNTGTKLAHNEYIRITDGASFYHQVTGDVNALANLFQVLPAVINDCSDFAMKTYDLEKLKKFFEMAYGS